MKVFAPFQLDTDNQCLSRDGERVPLTPRAFGVLAYLVDHAGTLVGQNELLDALWAEKFVQPEVLKTHILEIRNALGDDAKNPKFIETQPRRGYRFVGHITDNGAPPTAPVAPAVSNLAKRIWLAGTAASLILIAVVSGFVFYFRRLAPAAPVFKFEVPLPEHVTLSFARFAVSPDGKHLVFWGVDPGGRTRLWLRDLDSLNTRVLPETDTSDARIQPAWSPDSRYIAFNAYGKIKRIDIAGGPPQVVCDVPGGLAPGLAWTRDNQIVFGTGSERIGIMRAPASGGKAQAVTELDRSRGDYAHALPSILPDGKHFLYARASHVPANSGLYVGSLDAAPDQQGLRHLDLPALDSAPVFVPGLSGQGYLLYRHEGTIMARPFDSKRLELAGEWLPVANMARIEDAQPGFSVSLNGVLVYQNTIHATLQPTWFDRRGKVLGTVGESGEYRALSAAPDGKRVAAVKDHDLWLIDPVQERTTRLTFGAPGEDVSGAVWSPDGTRIAFGATFGHRDYLDIYEKTLTGSGNIGPLVQTIEAKRPTDWSRDGGYLLYDHTNPDGHLDFWLLPHPDTASADRKPFPILRTDFDLRGGVFSPDMRWVAYTSNESGKREVYVRSFVARPAEESAPGGGQLVSNNGAIDVIWPRDSKELFYLTPGGKIMAVPVTTSPDFHAGIPQPVFQGKAETSLWDVTADGQRLLVALPAETSEAPFTVLSNWQAALGKN